LEPRNFTNDEKEEIREYLSLDESGLYSLIPSYLPAYERTVFAPNGQIAAGSQKFEELRPRLYRRICTDWNLCNKLTESSFSDSIYLAALVGDIVSTTVHGLPPFLIAAILVKMGLKKFCECPGRHE
jgi:hypothetical protein